MDSLPIYLINLDGSNDRLSAATAAMQAEGKGFERHAAFDGRHLEPSDIPQYDASAARALMGRELTGGELGCFISHVQCAERFLNSGAEVALVLEDDMKPLPGGFERLESFLALIQQQGAAWNVAHLAAERLKIATPLHDFGPRSERTMLLRAHYFPMRTTALLWSRGGAEKFLQSAYPITCPVDIHLRRLTQQDDSGVALSPPSFSTTGAASEILAAAGAKRGTDSRSAIYPLKRAARLLSENRRANLLQRRARRNQL